VALVVGKIENPRSGLSQTAGAELVAQSVLLNLITVYTCVCLCVCVQSINN
jgi:hypothetical protein